MTPDESIRRIAELTKKRQYLLGFQPLKLVTNPGVCFHFICHFVSLLSRRSYQRDPDDE
jgi:hypothetical protein